MPRTTPPVSTVQMQEYSAGSSLRYFNACSTQGGRTRIDGCLIGVRFRIVSFVISVCVLMDPISEQGLSTQPCPDFGDRQLSCAFLAYQQSVRQSVRQLNRGADWLLPCSSDGIADYFESSLRKRRKARVAKWQNSSCSFTRTVIPDASGQSS